MDIGVCATDVIDRQQIPALAGVARNRAWLAINLITPAGLVAISFGASVDVTEACCVLAMGRAFSKSITFMHARGTDQRRPRPRIGQAAPRTTPGLQQPSQLVK
jgi:hypothetical protein